jgi:hypothetical protein
VLGALFGLPVLAIWWVTRSDVIPFDPTAGLVLIALMFVAAGFFGGLSAGFVAGCVGALTVPGDLRALQDVSVLRPDVVRNDDGSLCDGRDASRDAWRRHRQIRDCTA